MKQAIVAFLALTSCASSGLSPDSEIPRETPTGIPEVAALHPFLERLVGDWELRSEVPMGEGLDPMYVTSRERVTAVGPWISSQLVLESTEGDFSARLLVAYDEDEGGFTGSWIDSGSTHMWIYRGWLEGDTLTLESEGPLISDPTKTALYRDITEFDGDDRRIQRSVVQTENGEWTEFSTGEARRVR